MDFQVVVLAGGNSKTLAPLISKEVPKALLPVANRPVLSYVLELLEANDLKHLLVVVEGQDAARRVGSWISSAYADRLNVEVAAVAEDVGTAGALRAVSPLFSANDIMVVSGDLVSDVHPGAIAATHRRHDAVVTTLLCAAPVSGSSDGGSSGGKDKAKKQRLYNIVGLDPTQQFLLLLAAGAEVEKDVRVQKSILRAVGQMEIRGDLMDAHLYAFKRAVLQEILDEKPMFQSIRQDILPYLVRSQLRSELSANGQSKLEDSWHSKAPIQNIQSWFYQHQASVHLSFHEFHSFGINNRHAKESDDSAASLVTHKCCAYIASKSKYCARLNSIQAFCDINRDVIGEASHLSGYSFSAQNNIIHPSAQLGLKTTVGPQCMLDEGSQLGDKCSVKRSVVGRHCRIGSNVKIVNSIVMNHVTIEDGCLVQGSVVCSNVHIQERAVLKDCQIGAGYIVAAGSDHKAESLAKK